MPTLAAGNKPSKQRSKHLTKGHGKGFTLLELLVVLAIVAIATGAAVLALRPQDEQLLDNTAQRVAAQLESVRAFSRASGIAIYAAPDAEGKTLVLDPALSNLNNIALPDRMSAAVGTPSQNTAAVARIRLGPEPLIGPQQLRLAVQERAIWVSTDGLRPFEVRNAEPTP